jgi:hypothetical protein
MRTIDGQMIKPTRHDRIMDGAITVAVLALPPPGATLWKPLLKAHFRVRRRVMLD